MIPEQQARNLLEEHGINSLPINPLALAETLDVSVQVHDYGSAFEGMLIVNADSILLGINSRIQNQHRKKFTCAHELGHLTMDIGVDGGTFQCAGKDMESFSKKVDAVEVRANRFAGELLLPKFLIETSVKDNELSWKNITAFKHKSPHCARHTFATNLAGLTHADTGFCRLVLGHKDEDTTLGYVHLFEQINRQARSKVLVKTKIALVD